MYSVYYSTIPLSIVNLLLSSCSHNAFGAGVRCWRSCVRCWRSCVRCWRLVRSCVCAFVRSFGAGVRAFVRLVLAPAPPPPQHGRAGWFYTERGARSPPLASARAWIGAGFSVHKNAPAVRRGRGAVCLVHRPIAQQSFCVGFACYRPISTNLTAWVVHGND